MLQPFETAPKDGTRFLAKGYWNGDGTPHVCIASWGSFMSDGTGFHWIYEGCLGNMRPENITVTFTHWAPLPSLDDEK